MKALIFAAGLGTRLRPLTDHQPKALVKVAGKPLLQHVIERVAAAGFEDITINIHHFGEQIIDFVESNHHFGLQVHISDERDLLLDTGGGVLQARQWLDGEEPFLVHNADILTSLDYNALYHYHLSEGSAVATVLAQQRTTQRYLLFDQQHRLRGWQNKRTGELLPPSLTTSLAQQLQPLAFGGVHVMSPSIFPLLEQYATTHGRQFSIIPFYISVCGNHLIRGYHPTLPYRWLDVGKLETLAEAERIYAQAGSTAAPDPA